MAMGKRQQGRQETLRVATTQLVMSAGHPLYEALGRALRASEFDEYVEGHCQEFYADGVGRPGLAPGVYFRMLLVGYFEGIDSERGIARRCNDSLAL